jgi:hypothetical protein
MGGNVNTLLSGGMIANDFSELTPVMPARVMMDVFFRKSRLLFGVAGSISVVICPVLLWQRLRLRRVVKGRAFGVNVLMVKVCVSCSPVLSAHVTSSFFLLRQKRKKQRKRRFWAKAPPAQKGSTLVSHRFYRRHGAGF